MSHQFFFLLSLFLHDLKHVWRGSLNPQNTNESVTFPNIKKLTEYLISATFLILVLITVIFLHHIPQKSHVKQ